MSQTATIQHQAVESSTLASVGYRAEDRVLEIQFRSGTIYPYFSVPEAIYRSLLSADSKGRYFNQSIRGHFPYYERTATYPPASYRTKPVSDL